MSGSDAERSADAVAFAARAASAMAFLAEVQAEPLRLLQLEPQLRAHLLELAGRVARPDLAQQRAFARAARKQRKAAARARDQAALAETGIRRLRQESVFPTPLPPPVAPGADIDSALAEPVPGGAASGPRPRVARNCYVCKDDYTELHHFYDALCPTCAELNWRKRHQTADLRGRVALVTGARVKIGYQAAILLLRAGCRVLVTTRFPRDAALRYAREPDFANWRDRLQVHGLDLRHTPSVEAFARRLCQEETRLDYLLHNACQTVRRPAGFYQHLLATERGPIANLPAAAQTLLGSSPTLPLARAGEGIADPVALSQLELLDEDRLRGGGIFPEGRLDQDLQQVDLRTRNSWRLPLAEVSTIELLEVQLVNAVAPFVLSARLKPLFDRVTTADKHIVNVSAMEGQFYRSFKTDKHPHTNMAKAALNMLTRTSARDYVRSGIHMNSVDTGWVTDEDPAAIAERKAREHGFQPPLDIVDGAARIVDPIFSGANTGVHVWGQFLKDYRPVAW